MPQLRRLQRPISRRVTAFLPLALALALPTPVLGQAPGTGQVYDHTLHAPTAQAVRATGPVSIDGRLDEAVWMTAPPISDFWQTTLNIGAPVTERTEVRFLYDDDFIYVGAWLWDDGEVLTRLARRDAGVPDADFFVVLFDSYHDHRIAYRFATSPSGMKRDEIVTQGYGGGSGGGGGFGDTSWDPIWDIKTSITEEGWFVEMRVPFSQLRFRDQHVQDWGLQVERKIRRHGEDTVWAYTPPEERGGVARYGHLVGIEGIRQGKRLEILPFMTGAGDFRSVPMNSSVDFANPYRSGRDLSTNFGADLKYRLGASITLDATVNPDFGQVELDPAVINLSAFETRFDERRPFFVEGSDIFRFSDNSGGTQLLYSRRIGRQPQGAVGNGAVYSDVPSQTTILGAGKITWRTANGWSLGFMNALTGTEEARWIDASSQTGRTEVEPMTNYFVTRVRRDLEAGARSFGVIATAVNRSLGDDALSARLHTAAYATGVDGRIEWSNRTYVAAARFSHSYVTGSAEAIDRTQRSSARYLYRPDQDHLDYDPTLTSLSGFTGRFELAKQAGAWQAGGSLNAISPTYEVNDLGFQGNADRIDVSTNFSYSRPRPGAIIRSFSARTSPSATFNFAGETLSKQMGINLSATHAPTFRGMSFGFTRQFESLNDRLTRGGPVALDPAGFSTNLSYNTDSRGIWQVRVGGNYSKDDGGGWGRGVNGNLTLRLKEIYEFQFGPSISWSRSAAQYVTSVANSAAPAEFAGRRYVFAAIDQTTASMNMRFNLTLSPELTVEFWAQPFISSGDYFDFKELAAARTFDFNVYGEDIGTIDRGENGRYTIRPQGLGGSSFTITDPDFNSRSLRGNAVVRWEWRTGSTLFFVWQQVRSDRLTGSSYALPDQAGSFDFGRDAGDLFSIPAENLFMIKMTYWLNP